MATATKKKPATKKQTTAKKPTPQKTTKSTPPQKPQPVRLEPPEWKPIKKRRKKKQEPPKAWHRKSIAQRTVARKTRPLWRILSLLALIPLAGIWYLFTYVIMGYSFSALVSMCLMGIILFYNAMPLVGKKFPTFSKVVTRIVTVILCLGLLVVGVTEALIIKASFCSPRENVQYLVVLGAKVRPDGPSVSLQNRIDGAYDYLTAHPNTIAVVTGGKGADEPMTEAECMYTHLVAMGIDPDRIWKENRATSTWENLKFTLDLIEEKTGTRPTKLGVVSSEYHLFRASLFAKEHGVEFVGIPAHTTRLSQMINHFMREVAGVWHYILLGGTYE